MALQTGQILDGKYRIIREIGHGSMGAVFEGENIMIHRRVAIKVLHPALAENSSTVQRFEREAQAAGRIGSDHIVEVLDLGSLRDGSYYMVMEFLEGLTLSKRIRSKGRLVPRELAPFAQQLLTGLEAAHKAGIIHRDLKPDNVFLQESRSGHGEFVKILDFGVSKFNPLNAEEHLALTRAGAVVGTPFYMSPEQAKGARDIDARADLYSVGVILFEGVTGQKPFHAGTFSELIFKIVLEAPPPPEHFVPDLDPAFSRIIRRAMAREPSERYQSAAEMRDALSIWLHTGRDVAPGTQLAAPLPPPPSGSGRSLPPPPGSVEEDDNAATRIVDPEEEADGGATQIVDAPPATRTPSVRPGGPPAPPSRRPKQTVPLTAEKPAVGMPAGAPKTSQRSSRPPAARAGASAARSPGVQPAPHAAASSDPTSAAGAGPPARSPREDPPAHAAAAGAGAERAKAPPPPERAAGADDEPKADGSTETVAGMADEASTAPTPPRGIPGLQPITSGRTLSIAAGVLGVLALTAVGVGVVVAASGSGGDAPEGLTLGASQHEEPARAALPTEPTAPGLEETPTDTAEPVESATVEETSETVDSEAASATTTSPTPEPIATTAPPPPPPAPRATRTSLGEDTSAPPSAPPSPPPPPPPTATAKTKGKQGRSYATEL